MSNFIIKTNFEFGQADKYEGKVRDVYFIGKQLVVMAVTDRISAFDHVLPVGIPYKGQVLNQIAAHFLDATKDICPNWKISTPDPMVTAGYRCEPFAIEVIVRGYLTGSAWKAYKTGVRAISGAFIPEGMKENQRFDKPILTPTTKEMFGKHDEPISRYEIVRQGLASQEDYEQIEKYAQALFERGSEIAARQGLILVDTKYEFGKKDGKIYLIDEVHTPDSSRYFYADDYEERFARGEQPRQLSKEFVRKWLEEQGFTGKFGQKIPELSAELVEQVSKLYIELYERVTGETFVKAGEAEDIASRIEGNINKFLSCWAD